MVMKTLSLRLPACIAIDLVIIKIDKSCNNISLYKTRLSNVRIFIIPFYMNY
jgi:hypothetical protein